MKHNIIKILSFCIVFVFILVSSGFCEIVFRFDDYPSNDIKLLELQQKVILSFKERDIALTVAVIPSRLDNYPDALEFLKKNNSQVLEIALHGWDHSDLIGGRSYNNASEFAGIAYEEQLNRIHKGFNVFKSLLSIEAKTFVPPFNTYDSNTVSILKQLGFKNISASFNKKTMEYGELTVIPETCLLKDINKLKKIDDKLYVVMFHEYDFIESENPGAYFSIEELDNLLDNLKKQQESEYYTVNDLAQLQLKSFDNERINSIVPLLNYAGTPFLYFPAHWVVKLPKYYGTADFYKKLLNKTKTYGIILDIIVLGLIILSAFFVNGIARGLYSKPSGRNIVNIAGAVFAVVAILLTIHGAVKVKQGKSDFAYKYRGAIVLSTAYLIGMLWKKKR